MSRQPAASQRTGAGRNALLAWGNVAARRGISPSSESCDLVRRFVDHHDMSVRDAAVWAWKRAGLAEE